MVISPLVRLERLETFCTNVIGDVRSTYVLRHVGTSGETNRHALVIVDRVELEERACEQ
jgi:hypothetical protein